MPCVASADGLTPAMLTFAAIMLARLWCSGDLPWTVGVLLDPDLDPEEGLKGSEALRCPWMPRRAPMRDAGRKGLGG